MEQLDLFEETPLEGSDHPIRKGRLALGSVMILVVAVGSFFFWVWKDKKSNQARLAKAGAQIEKPQIQKKTDSGFGEWADESEKNTERYRAELKTKFEQEEKRRKELDEKNAYLQNPTAALDRAKATLRTLQTKADNGELPLPPREGVLAEGCKAEYIVKGIDDLLNVETIPAPPYLQQLFQIAIANHPNAGEMKKLANFKLWVCRGLEFECIGTFSLPQGTVRLSLEAIAFSQNEAELVGVMGHEVTHVLNEDSRKAKALDEKLEKFEHKFAMERAQELFPDEESLGFKQQIRADLGGLATLKNAGYDPCAIATFGERFGLEKHRVVIASHATSCGGNLWRVKNKKEFNNFKRQFVRIDPEFRSDWRKRMDALLHTRDEF